MPDSVAEFLIQELAALPHAARLAVVLDPYGDLNLEETLVTEGRNWSITRYDGNDLAFRQAYRPTKHDLIWVTCSPGWARGRPPRIELRSMMDVWRRADKFVDASLPGALRQLVPNESWPVDPVWQHRDILGHSLTALVSGVKTLRPHLEHGASFDAHAVRALALQCLQPDLPVQSLLFRQDTPAGVLDAYVRLLWKADWGAQGMTLLQTQAQQAPRMDLGDIIAWLDVPPSSLAVYLYLRRLLGRYGVRGVANQLRGLGVLDFDPEPLELWADSVLVLWDRDPDWRREVVARAEETLQVQELERINAILGLDSSETAFAALLRADTPAAIYTFGTRFFRLAFEARSIWAFTPKWEERRPSALIDLPSTPFTTGALALASIFDELAVIDRGRTQQIPVHASLAELLDWYVQHGLYDLEYAHARATQRLLYLSDEDVKPHFEAYLKFLRGKVRDFLDELDHALAKHIASDWAGFLGHPRLSTRILWDAVKTPRLAPTDDKCLWIIVLDGMRWDTWERHVKPRLLEKFEIVSPEKAYLCLLPSWTGIARTGLLAGKLPAAWRSYAGRFTKDQEQLLSRLMDLPRRGRQGRIRFHSGMESDLQYDQLDASQRLPYNALIYNVSDDNLHSQRGSLVALNETVDRLLGDILQALDNLVEPGDTLVVSSDHGFVELIDGDEAAIPDDARWQRYREGGAHPVRYRYATTHDLPDDAKDIYQVEYPGLHDRYTVAIGRRWFKRANWRGRSDRYAHGGLSFAEMAVPGVVLRRIVEPHIELVIQTVLRELEITEGDVQTLRIRVVNLGNALTTARLRVQADTASEAISSSFELRPGEHQEWSYPVEGVYRRRSDGTTESTRRVDMHLVFTDLDDTEKRIRKHVPVRVSPRTDVVEMDFAGLDDLDI